MLLFVSAGLLVGVWFVGYYRLNVSWVIVPSLVGVAVVEYRKSRKSAARTKDSQQSLLGGVEELPSWVSISSAMWTRLTVSPRITLHKR